MDTLACSNEDEGAVRLTGGLSVYEGQVEVCLDGLWSIICNDHYWDHREATVICYQLGYLSAGNCFCCGGFK